MSRTLGLDVTLGQSFMAAAISVGERLRYAVCVGRAFHLLLTHLSPYVLSSSTSCHHQRFWELDCWMKTNIWSSRIGTPPCCAPSSALCWQQRTLELWFQPSEQKLCQNHNCICLEALLEAGKQNSFYSCFVFHLHIFGFGTFLF